MSWIQKIQNQSERARKIIFWAIIIAVGGSLVLIWARSLQERMQAFKKENLMRQMQVPSLQERLKEGPKMPEVPKEELERWEKLLQEAQNAENIPSPSPSLSPSPSPSPSQSPQNTL